MVWKMSLILCIFFSIFLYFFFFFIPQRHQPYIINIYIYIYRKETRQDARHSGLLKPPYPSRLQPTPQNTEASVEKLCDVLTFSWLMYSFFFSFFLWSADLQPTPTPPLLLLLLCAKNKRKRGGRPRHTLRFSPRS